MEMLRCDVEVEKCSVRLSLNHWASAAMQLVIQLSP